MEEKKKIDSITETENQNIESENSKADVKSNLEDLLFDSDNDEVAKETPEESAVFEAFMAEYRTLMTKNNQQSRAEEKQDNSKDNEKEYLLTLPRKKKQKSVGKIEENITVTKREDWDENITLDPEVYEDPAKEESVMYEEIPYVEESLPDFNLGEKEETDDDKFQLSINFDGERKSHAQEEIEEVKKYDPEKPRIIDMVYDFAEMFVFVLLAVIVITSFLFKHSVVDGSSMNNTLENGEHLIITDLFYTPQRYDIVVFEDYSTSLKKAVVKRIIGLPGETVEVKRLGNGQIAVFINGSETPLPEEYAYNSNDRNPSYLECGKITLGENEVFVMGDNRYNSNDSRNPSVGPIEIDSILGKVVLRFYPFDKFGTVE